MIDISTLKKSGFDPYLNGKFEIHTESAGVVEVELIEITDESQGNMESFSLVFKGPLEKPFEQRLHRVKHPKMGEFDLFLVPITYGKMDAMYYQAVFNRLPE
ncbi:MAG: hypothetical protein PVH61_14705 [Candidatus Aminicenantes bacterium]